MLGSGILRGRNTAVWLGTALLLGCLVVLLAGCANGLGGGATREATSTIEAGGLKIAFLLPDTEEARYEAQDKPLFEAKVKELSPNAQVLYSNADRDAAQQERQADAALAKGADVLVLDAVDSTAAASIVAKAAAKKVSVIGYDRLIVDADVHYHVSFDSQKVGQLQGKALLEKLATMDTDDDDEEKKTIVMINGPHTDKIAKLYRKGARGALDEKVKVGASYDIPEWSPAKAQSEMAKAIKKLDDDGFDGVYCANDAMCGGVVAAMEEKDIDPKTKPTTGQGAELAAIQRILLGQQYMTVYEPVKLEAEAAAELAVSVGSGRGVPTSMELKPVENGVRAVPSVLLTPVAVTKDNIESTVVADGFLTASQILSTPELRAAGKAIGLQ